MGSTRDHSHDLEFLLELTHNIFFKESKFVRICNVVSSNRTALAST